MKFLFFCGIDISKEWFDAAILKDGSSKTIVHKRFDNNSKGFKAFKKWLIGNKVFNFSNLLICMEHTGVYTVQLCHFLGHQNITYTLVPGAEIAHSCGITRGKSDKLDAKKITKFAYKNREDIRMHTLPTKSIRKLKTLLNHRERLVQTRKRFKTSISEFGRFEDVDVVEDVCAGTKNIIQNLSSEIKLTEKKIDELLAQNPELSKNYKLLLSVPGIGRQNALYMIVFTQNFVSFNSPKKFAAYAGIAPFPNRSGKSRQSKNKVSHKANKKMKTLLSSAVVTTISNCAEYKIYYHKQLEKGKNEFSIKNVIRNKIVARAFAVIKRRTPYVNTHAFA